MSTPLRNCLRKLVRFIAIAIATLVSVIILAGIYGAWKAIKARERVEAFHNQLAIGAPVAGLEHQAKGMRLKFRRLSGSGDKDGRLLVWDGYAFSRWYLEISYRDGRVIDKKISFED